MLRILRCYLETNTLSFTNICKQANYPTDLGGYYIRHLVDNKSLVKTGRGQYMITPFGKQQFLFLEKKQSRNAVGRARLCVMLIVKQGEKFVVIRRKQQPFIGFVEWPAMTLTPGEGIAAGAEKLLKTRLGLKGSPSFVGFFRRIDMYENTVFDDKLFAIHSFELEPEVAVPKATAFGDNLLLRAVEFSTIEKPARALHDIFRFSQQTINYEEQRYLLLLEDIIPAE